MKKQIGKRRHRATRSDLEELTRQRDSYKMQMESLLNKVNLLRAQIDIMRRWTEKRAKG